MSSKLVIPLPSGEFEVVKGGATLFSCTHQSNGLEELCRALFEKRVTFDEAEELLVTIQARIPALPSTFVQKRGTFSEALKTMENCYNLGQEVRTAFKVYKNYCDVETPSILRLGDGQGAIILVSPAEWRLNTFNEVYCHMETSSPFNGLSQGYDVLIRLVDKGQISEDDFYRLEDQICELFD